MKNLNLSFSSYWLGSAESRIRRKLLVVLFTLVPMLANAYDVEIDGIYYNLNSSWGMTAEVTSGDSKYSGSIVIPEYVTYNGESYEVTSIGSYAFMDCSNLTDVKIPNSVTSIGYLAFGNCYWLASVDMPNSLTNIDDGAFLRCSSLTSVIIPNSVTNIGYRAFYWCSSLTSVTIPNMVTNIGDNAFEWCWNIKEIHSYMEEPCWFNENVFEFEVYSNATLFIPYWTKEKYESTAYWSNFVLINTPEDVLNVETHEDGTATVLGFKDMYQDTQILNIPELITLNGTEYSVTSIGDDAFLRCSSLTSVTIPNSVTSIGSGAFYGCNNLAFISVDAENPYYCTRDNVLFDIYETTLIFCSRTKTGAYIIPNTVTTIDGSAFSGCSGLTSVEIPNSVTEIYGDAFGGCSGLTSIELPYSVPHIWGGIFKNCSGLISIKIPNSVTSIGGEAFKGCSSLTSVEIPNSVKRIGMDAFLGCTSLTSVGLPNSITSIESGAFRECSSLTSITIPNSITSIESGAFRDCSSLTSITIPNSVTSIGGHAFEHCTNLTSVIVPNSVTSIGESAFQGCSGLSSIEIPNSVTKIYSFAFYYCSNLNEIVSYIIKPFAISKYVFYSENTKDRTLYVPQGTAELYRNTAGWNEIKNIVEMGKFSEAEWSSLKALYGKIAPHNTEWAQKWQNVITTVGIEGVGLLDGLTLEDGHVVGIDLSNQKLAGQFPSILLTFPKVKEISLNGNHFDGDIQTIIEELSLYVTNNDPSFVSELQSLDLSGNNLTGNIGALAYSTETTPSILSRFPSLKTLNASNNKFEDIYPALPASITNLDISNQKMDRVVELNMSDLSLEDFSSKVPTILLYDKVNRTYKNSINLLCTKADLATFNKYNTKEWAMQLQIDDNQLSIPYVSAQKEYHGESGDTLNVLNMTGNDATDGSSFRIALSFNQGDANFINGVDATDLQTTILYAFGGYRNYPFNFTAADTYKDGIINVQDVICTVNILLDSHNEQAMEARSKKVNMADMEAKPDTDAYLYVKDGKVFLHSRVPVASLSIKADGNVKWNIERLGLSQSTANGNVVAYSLNGTTIPSYEDVVLGECTHAKLYSVSLSDTDAQPISVNFGNSATSIINTSNATNGDMKIYDVSGYRLNKMRKGINIIRNNGTTKKIYK